MICDGCRRKIEVDDKSSSYTCLWPDCGYVGTNVLFLNYMYCTQCGTSWEHIGSIDAGTCPSCMEYWLDDNIDILTETEYNELKTTSSS